MMVRVLGTLSIQMGMLLGSMGEAFPVEFSKSSGNERKLMSGTMQPEPQWTWCRYGDENGKTVLKGKCAASFQATDPCNRTRLDGSYVLRFSEESQATIESACKTGDTDLVNGIEAWTSAVRVNGRRYYESRLQTGETFVFEAASSQSASYDTAPWSQEWADQGLAGQCYSVGSPEPDFDCRRSEACTTGGESGEESCRWYFRSGGEVVFEVGRTEELYDANGKTFFSSDIVQDDGATCYPAEGSGTEFCFEEAQRQPAQPARRIHPEMSTGKGFEGNIYAGTILFGVDNLSFTKFLEENKQKVVYLNIGVGYDINTPDAVGISKECGEYRKPGGSTVEGGFYIKFDSIYMGLTNRRLGELACGDLLVLDLTNASTSEAGTGTGFYAFSVNGLFEVSRRGRWNDMQRTYVLRGIEASYAVLQSAKERANTLKDEN